MNPHHPHLMTSIIQKAIRPLLLLVLAITLFQGCAKEIITPADETSLEAAIPYKRPAYRGIYINDFYPASPLTPILGDPFVENIVLNWVVNAGFNYITLYDVRDALNAGQSAALAQFVQKARSAPYNLKVSFVTAGNTSLTAQINYYNSVGVSPIQKQQGETTEYEFWNTGNSFGTYLMLLNNLQTFAATTTNPVVTREAYVSQFTDAAGVYTNTLNNAKDIVQRADRIFLVHYATNAWNLNTTLQTKLQLLADAGAALNKVVQVVILFNVNTASSDPNIYNYFSVSGMNQPWDNAFVNLRTQYNASTITNKSFLTLYGYQIYRYSNASLARP